jgi:hypothetical protein
VWSAARLQGKSREPIDSLRKCIRPLGGERSLLAMMSLAACSSDSGMRAIWTSRLLGHLPLAVDNWSPSEPTCAFHKTFVYKKKVLPTPRG